VSRRTKSAPDIDTLATSFRRHLRASNAAPRTIQSYFEAVEQFEGFLVDRGMPTAAETITREHLESYLEDVLGRHKPTTALARYKSLQQFFRFLEDEGEIAHSPWPAEAATGARAAPGRAHRGSAQGAP
jgi:site-specific recombinase XerD